MSIVEATKLDPALNFRTVQSTRSSPQFRKVYPANGGSRTVNMPASGASQNVLFNIPAECVNLGESYLEYDLTLGTPVAGQYCWMFKDVHGEFDSLNYRDTGTMSVVEVRNLHQYQQITNRLNYSPKDLDFHDNLTGLVRTNSPLSDVKCVRFDGNPCSIPFIEPQQMACVTSVAGGASTVQFKKIYLKDLVKDSYFGLAKNQIMPIETYLEINFSNASGRIGFSSLSAVNPNSTPIVFSTDAIIGHLTLNLCVEQNQELVKMLKAEVSKGISIPIPWTRVHQLTSSSTAQSYVYNLPLDNKQHGQRIKRIIYAPILSTGAGVHQVYDHSNVNGARIMQYQTELDNQKMQRDIIRIDTTAGDYHNDDYMFHRKLLKNTLYFNQPIYNQNWIHVDSFDYGELNDSSNSGNIMVDGLNLDKPMTWTFNSLSNAGVAFINTAIVCGQKMLSINASSFIVA